MPINDFVAGTIALSLMLQPIQIVRGGIQAKNSIDTEEASRSLNSYGKTMRKIILPATKISASPNLPTTRHCPERYDDVSLRLGLSIQTGENHHRSCFQSFKMYANPCVLST